MSYLDDIGRPKEAPEKRGSGGSDGGGGEGRRVVIGAHHPRQRRGRVQFERTQQV